MADAAGADGTYVFDVAMSCSGCSGAVERALKRVEGISATVDLDAQKVTVADPGRAVGADVVLEKIKKTGKAVKSVDRDDGKGPQTLEAAA